MLELKFVRERETKNKVVFREVPAEGRPPLFEQIYVGKWAAGNAKRMTVQVELEE